MNRKSFEVKNRDKRAFLREAICFVAFYRDRTNAISVKRSAEK